MGSCRRHGGERSKVDRGRFRTPCQWTLLYYLPSSLSPGAGTILGPCRHRTTTTGHGHPICILWCTQQSALCYCSKSGVCHQSSRGQHPPISRNQTHCSAVPNTCFDRTQQRCILSSSETDHRNIQNQCKEGLIILLYCFLTVTPGFLDGDAFGFALPHAINLAEAGVTVANKRIGVYPFNDNYRVSLPDLRCPGYLFCAEVMPINHELQLMLVNTLRKVRQLICYQSSSLSIWAEGPRKPRRTTNMPRIGHFDRPLKRRCYSRSRDSSS